MSDSSCFIQKLQHYMPLTEKEREALGRLEENPRTYEPGDVIYAEGRDSAEALYIIKEGRLHSSTILADGSRAILKIHFPGDMLGTASVPFETATATTVVAARSCLCRFPRKGLKMIFEEHPRLAALFYAIAALENVALQDRLKSIGRTEGKARVGALILDTLSRLRVTSGEPSGAVELNMTQSDMGDAVGLTNIHVNRCLRELAAEGFIKRSGGAVTVLDEARLSDVSHYTDRYRRIVTDWFPEPR